MRGGALALAVALLAGCDDGEPASTLGDPDRGRTVIARYECGACHRIPGIAGARGKVGPPLAGFGRRAMIAGTLPNRPDALLPWLRDPPAQVAGTAMPALGLTEREAGDVAAYLYTLR
ncbi:MAG: c-type cytochrome [Alphaproteobacteria bacterium]|nr:c-type cytochrome [Alphaproteobacteria bacterium]